MRDLITVNREMNKVLNDIETLNSALRYRNYGWKLKQDESCASIVVSQDIVRMVLASYEKEKDKLSAELKKLL